MSGHSKWSTIKRQKGANDAKRGALFTKVAREISVAARQGGGDPTPTIGCASRSRRRAPINMPADNIKRAIEKATGGGDAEQFEEIVYEGYGPGGVAVLVEAQTDNRNRTAAEVRSMFTKAGGQLAGSGRGRLAVRAARPDHGPAGGSDATRSPSRRSTPARWTSTRTTDPIEIYTSARGPGGRPQGPRGAGVAVEGGESR
jgi:hypothetical protein